MIRLTALTALGLLLAGCNDAMRADGGLSPGQAACVPFAGTTEADLFRAVQAAVKEQYGVERAVGLSITSLPQYVQEGDGGAVRLLSSRAALRRVAQAQVRSEQGFVQACVRVELQRRQTQEYRAYQTMMSANDVPDETPLDQGATLEPERQEVWVTVRRDYDAERALIECVKALLPVKN